MNTTEHGWAELVSDMRDAVHALLDDDDDMARDRCGELVELFRPRFEDLQLRSRLDRLEGRIEVLEELQELVGS